VTDAHAFAAKQAGQNPPLGHRKTMRAHDLVKLGGNHLAGLAQQGGQVTVYKRQLRGRLRRRLHVEKLILAAIEKVWGMPPSCPRGLTLMVF
jgi:hypothetical protein